MADRYIRQVGGVLTEKEATVASAGATDAGEIIALDGAGKLDNSVLPTGIGADTAAVQASEALTAGDLVNIHDVGGAFRVRRADASTSGRQADGFVLAGVASGATATIYFEGTNNQVSGLTPGARYLSATTPGGTTSVAPTGAGQVVQRVGVAVSATALNFERGPEIVLA